MEIYALGAFSIIILIYSIILHELSHAVTALWLGDRTAKDAGRITLDPLPNIDPIGSFLLPIGLTLMQAGFIFGWAKPVPFNPMNLIWKKWGPVVVAIAGPIMNFLLAGVAALVAMAIPLDAALKSGIAQEFLRSMVFGDLAGLVGGDLSAIFYAVCLMMIYWNIVLGIFNLLPIPPLDGSKLLFALFPIDIKVQMFLQQWGFFIVIGLFFFTPLGNYFGAIIQNMIALFFNFTI
jgi:Zn-dependent protease